MASVLVLSFLTIAVAFLSCGEQVGPDTSRSGVDVSVTTTGSDLDPDGYSVVLDGGASRAVAVNGSVAFDNLTAGSHAVELIGLAPNCAVTGANPRSLTLSPNARAAVTMGVTCAAFTGELGVAVSTTGPDMDPDGYVVIVSPAGGQAGVPAVDPGSVGAAEPNQSQPVEPNGTVTFLDLPADVYTVQLDELAANCTSDTDPATVTVPADGTATVAFAVTCVARVGDLDVDVTSTGSDVDPDGYAVTVDGGVTQAVASTGSVTFPGLAEGDRTIELTGVAANCTVSGANPRTVAVPFNGTATASFSVTCGARTGELAVTVTTTGSDVDPDGYAVTVDGGATQAVAINGSVTLADLAEGDRAIELTGVAANCTVSGSNPRTVTVPYAATATTAFAVTCASRTGYLGVTVTTTGSDVDPDGYAVTVDGGPGQPVGINGSAAFPGVAEGDHAVELTGVAGNCTVSGSNPRTVTVPYAATASTAFTVTCVSLVGDLEVTATTTGSDLDPDGYMVSVDGGASQAVGINGSVTFLSLATGDHTIELTGLAANCTVSGNNPRTVSVPSAATATTAFAVTCVLRTGDLAVTVTTTGNDVDPDGYAVTVDGGAGQPVGTDGSLTFIDLAEGDHTVEVTGVAGNCVVSGANPRTVGVPHAGTASTAFSVTCVSRVGDLEVTATTTGSDLDPDGYLVSVDGGASQALGISGSVTFPDLAEGDHTVELTGLATNCAVSGANPRTVTVAFGGTVTTAFGITCVARLGDLDVSATTTGSDPDPDGFTVTVDGGPGQAIASNGSVSFTGLAEGDHTVALTGVAANCTVSGSNPRAVTVPYQGTATTAFDVTCAALVGDLEVTTTTTGSDPDPDGYTVTVDGGSSQAIASSGSVTFSGLAEGDHSVELTGVAPNCTVSGANPRTVAVPFNATATSTFTVTCVARTGDLDVNAATTGSDVDPDGYAVSVDGGPGQPLPINGTVTFTGLAEGNHTVELTGVVANCSVSGANPRPVAVPFDGTASTTFTVTCAARLGDLDVTVGTTGSDLDPDGYAVSVDGGPAQAVAINGSVSFLGLAEGDHSVELTGVAGNCTVSGANPRTVTVPYAGTATTAFSVSCVERLGDLDVTAATTGSDLDPNGYTVFVDGSVSQSIAINGTVTFIGLAEGDHLVQLTGVAPNCTVSGANPRTVAVPFAGTASTTFDVTCAARVGDLDVTTTTTGSDPDPDGYLVTVDTGPSQAIASNGTVTFTGLAEGSHSVELTGVAGNCTVSGANPRTVTVPYGGTATTAFGITCVVRLGDLEVSVTTSGSDLDPDGYGVTVDGGSSQPIGINGTVTYTGLAEGDHTVELTGVASNCTVSGVNPRTVAVPYQSTATTAYTVTCTPRAGDLEVTISTTGTDPDPDGYTVTVDGSESQAVGANGSVIFTELLEGNHSVALSGLATNCTTTANPRTVTVVFGDTATTTFNVDCVRREGDLEVNTATTGQDIDPDGYTVTVDGGSSQSIASNGAVTFVDLAEGDHSVELTGLATNCTLSGANPRTVTVPFPGTVTTTFDIDCVPRVGDLEVTTSTSGDELDPDGYTVTVDGGSGQAIAINDTVTYVDLAEGDRSVQLTGLAANCAVSGSNPRMVTVPFGGSAATTFTVDCIPTIGDLQVVTATTGSPLDPDGYTVSVDGGPGYAIGINGTVLYTDLSAGTHLVELSGISTDCGVVGPNPKAVTVLGGQTVSVTFDISCGDQILVGAGDISECVNDRDEYTAQILDTIPGTVFTAGDNVYPDGTMQDYLNCYDPTWGRHKARTNPALGNKEYDVDPTAQASFDYFGGQLPQPGYYSYDLGPWHIIVVNDNIDFDAGSTQDQWLQADLAASTAECTMAIWHKPRFFSNASGNPTVDTKRKILWDRLYAAGADVVINGHRHFYERFTPMDPDGNVDLAQGIKEFIVGTGGTDSAQPTNIAPNSELQQRTWGVIKFRLRAGGYDWEFIPAIPAGTTFTDSGTGTCH